MAVRTPGPRLRRVVDWYKRLGDGADESDGPEPREPTAARARRLRLPAETIAGLLAASDGHCDMCGSESPGTKNGWAIDHDHATGAVRGVLCHGCNSGLGFFADSPDRLRAAIAYLERASRQTHQLIAGGKREGS